MEDKKEKIKDHNDKTLRNITTENLDITILLTKDIEYIKGKLDKIEQLLDNSNSKVVEIDQLNTINISKTSVSKKKKK